MERARRSLLCYINSIKPSQSQETSHVAFDFWLWFSGVRLAFMQREASTDSLTLMSIDLLLD